MATTTYRCHNMTLKITAGATEYILAVVEGLDISLGYEGGPEAIYGQRTKEHSLGTKASSFTITRWFYADAHQEDLFLDLFDGELTFTLEGSLIDNEGNAVSGAQSFIKLTGCKIYRYRPRSGGADDILGEEASGFATDWEITISPT